MLKAVIDTNVFVSSYFGGIPKQIINYWKDGQIRLCLSQEIIEEYLEVLVRLGLDSKTEISNLAKLFAEGYNSLFAATVPELHIVNSDPDDNKFIECAVALDCKIIISGDKHLKDLKKYVDIKIMSPREFIDFFNRGDFMV